MTQMAEELAVQVGVSRACAVLNVPRSRLYRARQSPQLGVNVRPQRGRCPVRNV